MNVRGLLWKSSIGLIVAAGAIAWWIGSPPADSSMKSIGESSSPPSPEHGALSRNIPPPPATAQTSSTAPVQRTVGPAEQRLDVDALRSSLAGRPDAEAEVQRVVAFARFQDLLARYGEARASGSDKDKRALAQQILGELPAHVQRNEIVPVQAQAQALSASILADTYTDPATRDAAIQSMLQEWNAYAQQAVGPSPDQDPRHQDYLQQARQIVDDVKATVDDPEQRQALIGQRLQALRTQLYEGVSQAGAK